MTGMSSTWATTRRCFHQCTKCGILYLCNDRLLCKMPFNYGKCPQCHIV